MKSAWLALLLFLIAIVCIITSAKINFMVYIGFICLVYAIIVILKTLFKD